MEAITVDVAYWDLSQQRSRLSHLASLLSPEETVRADRLAIPAVRERFVLRHGILREMLGAMLGAAPAQLRFTHGQDGKPALLGGAIGFNLSKSGDGLLIAVARGASVGCDLERMRPNAEAKAIAARWFGARERAALARLEGDAFDRAFLRLWVRKEAILKAVGTGLQGPLGIDTGDPEPDGTARGVAAAGGRLWLADLEPAPGWLAAVAAERPMTVRLALPI